jgi:hypothetical protein
MAVPVPEIMDITPYFNVTQFATAATEILSYFYYFRNSML